MKIEIISAEEFARLSPEEQTAMTHKLMVIIQATTAELEASVNRARTQCFELRAEVKALDAKTREISGKVAKLSRQVNGLVRRLRNWWSQCLVPSEN